MTIRVIYSEEPQWPATANHPDALRLEFEHPQRGTLYVDYVGGLPTESDINAVLTPA